MNSRERVRAAINHLQPDRVPLDLGSTTVTGIVASAYARLRQALGLPPKPVQLMEPFLMLAQFEDDVRDALRIDTVGIRVPKGHLGIRHDNWKPWRLFDGTDVLIPGQLVLAEDENGDILAYPRGDASAPPSARMPRDGPYFDAIIRQEPIDEENLDPQAWVRDMYAVYGDEDLRYLEAQADHLYRNTDRALVTNLSGGAFGDIAHVPGVGVPYPKGIRDPLEWYVAHVTHPEYIKGIYELQCEIALENLRLLWQAVGSKIDVLYVSGTDFGTQDRSLITHDMYGELYQPLN